MTGLGDKVRTLRLARHVESGEPLLGDVWLDMSGLRDALAAAVDAHEETKRNADALVAGDRNVVPRVIEIANVSRAALVAVARQLEDSAA